LGSIYPERDDSSRREPRQVFLTQDLARCLRYLLRLPEQLLYRLLVETAAEVPVIDHE